MSPQKIWIRWGAHKDVKMLVKSYHLFREQSGEYAC